jgi:hypothetical protein
MAHGRWPDRQPVETVDVWSKSLATCVIPAKAGIANDRHGACGQRFQLSLE